MPIFSFLLLKGKCRACGQNIGWLPLAIELATVLIGFIPLLLLPADQAVAASVFGWLLLPLIILDHQHLWLPNPLVILLAVLGFVIGPLLTPEIALAQRVVGLVAGFMSLEIVRLAYKQFRQRDGMGAGDPKMFGALGIWLGWQALPITLLGASAIGLIVIGILRLKANQHRTAFPFGSYLGAAALAVVLTG